MVSSLTYVVSKISIPTLRCVFEIFKGRGVSKANFFKGRCEPNLEFTEGLVLQPKNPSWKGYGSSNIFTVICSLANLQSD